MKKTILLVTALLLSVGLKAQDKVEATIGADIVSQYIWRGQDLGSASLQPTVGVSYKGLSLTAWGSVGITESSDTKELDLTLDYSTGGFHIGITDYWFNTPNTKYFAYRSHHTSHVFEAAAGYDFGVLSVDAYVNFAGNDGVNGNGNRAYSSYIELNAPFNLGGLSWTATAGAAFPESTSYGTDDDFSVINLSLKAEKAVKITDSFSIPLFAGVTANPSSEKLYLVFGLSL